MLRIVETPSCGLFFLGGETLYKTAETYFKDLAALCFGKDGKQTGYRLDKPRITTDINKMCLFVWTHSPDVHSIGELMREYIEKHHLGTVTVSPKGKNPLHKEHDGAVVWTWVRDNVNFEKHCKGLLSPKDVLCPSTPPTAAASSKLEVAEGLIPMTLDNSSMNFGVISKASAMNIAKDGSGLQCLTSQMPAQYVVRQKLKAIS